MQTMKDNLYVVCSLLASIYYYRLIKITELVYIRVIVGCMAIQVLFVFVF